MTVTLRPATPQDGDGIAGLFMRTWHISLGHLVPPGFLCQFDYAVQQQKYAERAVDPGWLLLVAERDGQVVGMIGAAANATPPLSFGQQLRSMYVDPEFQGQGIGTALLERLFVALREKGAANVLLWCIRANTKACAFYERHGGRRITDIPAPEEYSAMRHVAYAWEL